mgnify:FL=1
MSKIKQIDVMSTPEIQEHLAVESMYLRQAVLDLFKDASHWSDTVTSKAILCHVWDDANVSEGTVAWVIRVAKQDYYKYKTRCCQSFSNARPIQASELHHCEGI